MAIDPTARRSRRALLASAVGGAAAVAAAQLAKPVTAMAVAVPVNLDVANPATGTTSIDTTAAAAAFVGTSSEADYGIGVAGKATFATNDTSYSNVGVYGLAGAEPEDYWTPDYMESGVYGYSDASYVANGVLGVSPSGYGVYGWGDYGVTGDGGTVGVEGYTDGAGVGVLGYAGDGPGTIPANVGVLAMAPASGVALQVSGRTSFSRSGRAYVSTGKKYVDVTVAGGALTSSSRILATATRYVSGTWVQAAVYVSSSKIRVYLNKAAPATVYFTWFVLN